MQAWLRNTDSIVDSTKKPETLEDVEQDNNVLRSSYSKILVAVRNKLRWYSNRKHSFRRVCLAY